MFHITKIKSDTEKTNEENFGWKYNLSVKLGDVYFDQLHDLAHSTNLQATKIKAVTFTQEN